MGDHLVKTLQIPECSSPLQLVNSKDASIVSITHSTISQCLWAWLRKWENIFLRFSYQCSRWSTSHSPLPEPDTIPPNLPFHHLNPNEPALSGFKRRPVRVISRSKFKWTVCVSIGCHWNASFYIMSPRRVVFLLLEIHFRGPAGAPWQWGVGLGVEVGSLGWTFKLLSWLVSSSIQ